MIWGESWTKLIMVVWLEVEEKVEVARVDQNITVTHEHVLKALKGLSGF